MPLPDWLAQLQARVQQFTQAHQRPWPWRDHLKAPFSFWGGRKEAEKTGQQIRSERVHNFAASMRAESVQDLQEILTAMVLSECAYKRPVSELLRHLHRFRNDFGSDLVPIKHIQVSLEHAPHRYLLAEAGDTLFASFIGTKQYRDFLADANFLQDDFFVGDEDLGDLEADQEAVARGFTSVPNLGPRKRRKRGSRPLVHRGFLARARGIPAVDIYRLARRTNRRLVLCGHSLGGAVAVLVTVAILKAVATMTPGQKQVPVKCITFSQPPVGNAALKDYVHQRGWQGHFRSFCIPEDIIPRILSPAYFQHYSLQAEELAASAAALLVSNDSQGGQGSRKSNPPLWNSLQKGLWRVPKLAPLVSSPGSAAAAWVKRRRGEAKNGSPSGGTRYASLSTPPEEEAAPVATLLGDALADKRGECEGVNPQEPVKGASNEETKVDKMDGADSQLTNGKEENMASPLYKRSRIDDSNNSPVLQAAESVQPGESRFWSRIPGRQLGRKGQSNLLPFCKAATEETNSVTDAEPPLTSEPEVTVEELERAENAEAKATTANEPRWGWALAEQIRDRVPCVRMAMPAVSMPSMPSIPNMPAVSMPTVPMPSYIPFGHLYLLMPTHAEHIGSVEYQRLISAGVRGWMAELQKRFHSHTMAQYRARFLNVYAIAMSEGAPFPAAVLGQQAMPWSAPIDFEDIEAGQIAEPTLVRTATSVVPLKWSGAPGQNGAGPIKVDVRGQGLHAVTRVEAQVDGHWCAASLERMVPPPPVWEEAFAEQMPLESMRVHIGPPLRNQGRGDRSLPSEFEPGPAQADDAQPTDQEPSTSNSDEAPEAKWAAWRRSFKLPLLPRHQGGKPIPSLEEALSQEEYRGWYDEGPTGEVVIHCSSDFDTSSKNVAMRLRRVRLIGLEGAGKTSLWSALMGQQGELSLWDDLGVVPDLDWREGVAEGVGYVDGVGVNLQDLSGDAHTLGRELHPKAGPLGRRIDAVVLVHNLASKIPQLRGPNGRPLDRPALSLLIDEVRSAGVPLILAVTNKFATSAERRYPAAASVMEAYHVAPSHVAIVNSRPYVVQGALHPADLAKLVPPPGAAHEDPAAQHSSGETSSSSLVQNAVALVSAATNVTGSISGSFSDTWTALAARGGMPASLPHLGVASSLVASAPRSLNPFKRKELVLPVEGVRELRDLVQSALEMNEEEALRETSEAAVLREQSMLSAHTSALMSHKKHLGPSTIVGAAMGAGVALVTATFFGSRAAAR